MAAVAELKSVFNKDGNIRESLDSILLLRRKKAGVEMPDTVFGADKMLNPTLGTDGGWASIGIVQTSGYTLARSREMVERRGHGYQSANRRRITSAPKTLTTTPLEWNALVAEIIYGMDLSTITPDTNGAYQWDEPLLPVLSEYEGILIVEDHDKDSGLSLFHALSFHKLVPSGEFTEVFNEEDARSTEIQFSADDDNERGKSISHEVGGPGFDAATTGFAEAPTGV